jgi:hypothetical protein
MDKVKEHMAYPIIKIIENNKNTITAKRELILQRLSPIHRHFDFLKP